MCSSQSLALSQTTPQMSSAPNLSFSPGVGTSTDSDGLIEKNPGQITQAPGAGTSDVQIGEQTQRTKLGSLVNFLGPILAGGLQGGLVGWAGGKGTPGGGFNAAQNYFNQQRQVTMQRAMMQRQAYNDQVQNAQRMAEAQYYARGGPVRQNAPVIGDNGNFWSMNPVTRQLEDTGVKAQPKAPKADSTSYDSDRGVIIDRNKGTFKAPVQEGSGDEGPDTTSTGLPTGPPTAQTIIRKNAGLPTSPVGNVSPTNGQIPGGAGVGGGSLPTSPNVLPPKTVKPGSETNQLETKAEASLRAQHPDWSDMQIYSTLKRAGQKPEEDKSVLQPAQERTLRSGFATREEEALRQLQGEQEKDINALKNDPEYEFQDAATQQQRQAAIYRSYATLSTGVHARMVQEAAGLGIDLDTPMSNGKKGTIPTKPARSVPERPGSVPAEANWNPQTKTWQLKRSGAGGQPPAGATMRVPASDGKMHWSDGKRDLGVVAGQ
jgi:hypothetical protein